MAFPFIDRYSAEARILPSLVLVIPTVMTVFGLYPPTQPLGSLPIIATGGAVAVVVLSHFVRSWGKAAEAELFRRWTGPPTTRRLRHRGAKEAARVRELHRAISASTGHRLPDAGEEARDPIAADLAYAAVVGILRELAGDAPRFDLVLTENASYGMRRNLWGARNRGKTVSALGALAGVIVVLMASVPTVLALCVIVLNVAAFAFWQWLVSDEWVREAAELYVDALFRVALAMGATRALASTSPEPGNNLGPG